MQQWKEGLLATKCPRPRRKLQKTVTKQHINTACRFDSSPSTDSSLPTTWTQPRPPPLPPKNKERPSPQREERPYERQQHFDPLERYPSHTVPRASHHILTNPQLHSSSGSCAGSVSSKSSTPKMRRRAHSPAYSFGQLEDFPKPPTHALPRTSSVDLIAEQYKAFLESQPSSADSDDYSEPALSPEVSDRDEPPTLPRQRSPAYSEREPRISQAPRRTVDLPRFSPTSDDGSTLVSHQSEAFYFKPFSFSPYAEEEEEEKQHPAPAAVSSEPPDSPTLPSYYHPDRHSITITTATEEDDNTDTNVGLQICLDLLTRELAASLPGRPSPSTAPPPRTAALQVWAMIEAYERLRDQMSELSHTHEQACAMEGMFDMWLRALYQVHDGMTGCRRAGLMDCGAEFGK